jgi:hypothetical protein
MRKAKLLRNLHPTQPAQKELQNLPLALACLEHGRPIHSIATMSHN